MASDGDEALEMDLGYTTPPSSVILMSYSWYKKWLVRLTRTALASRMQSP
jgi:hypothetical protein